MARGLFDRIVSHDSETADIQGKKALLCNDVPTCTDLARAGLGIICGGTFMIAPLIASGDLQSCLEQWHIPPMPVSIVYPPNRHLSNKLRVFVDWIAELFARHPSQKLS
ncbi:LysR substrate-binding domain-containing protein [Paraburkholderia sp.]|uniref:LysR substrate-binding domain-containing protein n=1 Tax=Paraburkholderia sp. TaxID=1926495 RepID=UPI0023A70EC8|nr:LysR substrate-binding domain-containing protein [Paraburkholderia sp.]MDE1180974.1 LysR substrate-binding domain-containing protein [Paraburkholderia sp.]